MASLLHVVNNTTLVEAPDADLGDLHDLDIDRGNQAPVLHLTGELVHADPEHEDVTLVGGGDGEVGQLGGAEPALVVGEEVVQVLDVDVHDIADG